MRRCPRCGRTLLESDFYRMGNRSVVEFVIGVACLIAATVMLYIAGMMRDRRIQAEFARRRAAREEREAERRSRR